MDIGIRKKNIIHMAVIVIGSIMTMACTPNEEVWTGENRNPIEVVCGKSCQTIRFNEGATTLSLKQRQQIKKFVYQVDQNQRIFVSPCVSKNIHSEINEQRMDLVKSQVSRIGYRPVELKPTLPENLRSKNCVNLVRGKLRLYVQRCPNLTLNPSVQMVGSSFGCTTSYNLAVMITNPWNLLALPGDNGTEGSRVALGEKNYREGKNAKLDMESST